MTEDQLKKTCPPCFTLEQWADWTHAYAAAGGRHALEDYCEDCTRQFMESRCADGKCSQAVIFFDGSGLRMGARV